MLKILRSIGVISVLVVMALQFQNCSTYNENTLFDSQDEALTAACEGDGCADPAVISISVSTNGSGLRVGPNEEFLQVSGRCNDALADDNVITAFIKDSGGNQQTLYQDEQGSILEIADIKCENGEFFAFIPVGTSIDTSRGSTFYLHLIFSTHDASGKKLQEKRTTGTKVVIEG